MSWMDLEKSQLPFEAQLAAFKALDEQPRPERSGPNNWNEVTEDDFSSTWDFEVYDQGNSWVFYPISCAALQWAYSRFPENTPRWGAKGFIVDYSLSHVRSKMILDRASDDQLISEDEYDMAMAEQNQLCHQGERL